MLLRSGSPAMDWRFYTGIFLFLMSMANLTAPAEPMSVEDYAKTASRTAVMANVCPRYFKLNVEQMRQWRRFAIEGGEKLSTEFDAILKAEIKRRNADVDRVGHRVWCTQMREEYGSHGIDIEAPTRPYEEEAEAATERMKADAKAQAPATTAAEITHTRSNGENIITVSGEIEEHDDVEFIKLAGDIKKLTVSLNSPGGSNLGAAKIGMFVRAIGMKRW